MATKEIGYIAEQTGSVEVRSANGVIKVVNVGDVLRDGDVLITGLNAQVVVVFYNGGKLPIGAQSEVLLDETVTFKHGPYDDADVNQIAALQKIIINGHDLDELEPTSAGRLDSANALHETSAYERDGREGEVDTRLTPFGINKSTIEFEPNNILDYNNSGIGIPQPGVTPPVVPVTVPEITISVISGDDIVGDSEDNAVTVNGTTTNVEDGQTVTVNIDGTNYTTTVSGNAWSITGIDLSGLSDGGAGVGYPVTADVSDTAGNPARATRPITLTDTTAPTITINVIAGDDIVDDSEDNAVTVNGTTTNVEDGQTVTVNIDGTNYTTTVTANTWSITGIDLSGLSDDGATGVGYPVTANVDDAAGNAAPVATRPITLTDTTAPTITINVIAGDDVVDDSEDNAVTVNGTTTNVEDGQTVTVNIDGTNYTATVSANTWSITGIDLSGLSDGGAGIGYPVTADVSDTAGNPASATRPITLTDTTAPTITINVIAGDDVVDDGEDNAVTVNGTTTNVEDGQTVTVNIDGTNYTTTVTGNAWSITGIDLSGLSDGGAGIGYPVTADVSDTAGNPASATRPITLTDSTAPTISINVIAGDDIVDDSEDNSVTVTGATSNVEDGQTVTVNIDGTDYTTTVTGNAWSITGIDLSGLSDGGAGVGYPVTANVDDAAGNAAPTATRPITLTDTTAPTITINVIAGDDVVDDSEDNAVTVNGTTTNVEDGQTVTVTIDGANYTTTVTGNAWSITGIDLSGLSDGGAGVGYPVTADVSDTAGNPTSATRPITLTDTTAPTISINVIAGDDIVDDSEDNAVTVNGTTTNVEDGQTVTVNIDGINYTTTVSVNTWSITGIDLSGLSDGGAGVGYPVTADVSDTAGNPAPTATRPITLTDTTAPTITINVIAGDDIVDDGEDNAVTVNGTTTNVEDGQTVTVTIDGTNYTTTVSANTWSITGIDLSGLSDGGAAGVGYPVTADVSDTAGNPAPTATRPITLTDTTAPTISINVIAGDDVVDDSEDNAVTVNGTTTNVEDGQTVTVTIDGNNYTTTVTGNAWSITGIDLSTLPDGVSYNVTANVDDAAGNAAPIATRPITLTDTTAPTITINVIAGDDVVDDSEDGSVTVTGATTNVEDGQTVTINIDGTDYTTTVTGNAWSITGIDLSGLSDGGAGVGYPVTADVSDTAGNPAPTATRPITLTDTTAPTITINVIAGDDVVDDSEDNAVTVNGATTNVEDGQTVTITIDGTDYTTTVTGNAWSITGIDLSGLSDGGATGVGYPVTANVDDAAGNPAPTATRPITLTDTTAPTISINVIAGDDVVDDSEDDSVTVNGTTTNVEDGQTVTVNIDGTNYTTTVSANTWSITGIDLSGLSDGGAGVGYPVTADVSDTAGNPAPTATRPITLTDTTAPTITINVIAGDDVVDDSEDNAVTVNGTTTNVEDGQTVTVNIDGTDYTTTVTGNAWSITGIDLSGLSDGGAGVGYPVTADVSDTAGNPAPTATRPITLTDTTAPTITINVIAGDDVVDDSEDNAVTVNGTTTNVEDGQTVTVNIDGTDYTTTVTGNAWSITGIDLSGLSDGGAGVGYPVTADVSDTAGNPAPTATRPITLTDTTAPTITINVIAGDDVVDDSEDNAVTVNGTTTNVEDGQTVTVNIDGTDYTTTVTGNAWSITGIDLSGLSDGGAGVGYPVTADVSDTAGNPAPTATRPITLTDTTAPTITINVIAGDDVVDDSEDNAVTVNGTTTNVEDGQTVTVNIDGTDYTTTVTGNAWSITGIDLSGLSDGGAGVGYPVTADVSDTAGNPAPTATRPITLTDTTAPTITINVIAGDDVVDDSEDNAVTVNGTTTNVEDGQTVTVNIDGTNYTTTVTGNAWSIPNIDLSTLPDGVSYNVTANVDDAAGNAAPVATRPITLTDTTAPTITINVIAGDDIVDDSEDNAVTVNGTTTNVEDGQTVTINIDGTNYTTTVTANTWSITGIDLSGLSDGGATGVGYPVTADVSDTAGNPAPTATRPITLTDTTAPTITINVIAGDDVVDDSEDNAVTVNGTTTNVEDGQTVTVTIDGTNYTTTVTANTWSITGIDLSGLSDGGAGVAYPVTADVSDTAGNPAPTATRPITLTDTTAPTISINVIAGDDVVDDSEDNAVTVNGTTTNVEDGQTVTVNIDGTDYTTTVTGNAWSITGIDLSGLSDGGAGVGYPVTANVDDAAGNAAPTATRPITLTDTTAPTISINVIAGDDVVDDSEDNAVTVNGTTTNVEDGQTVTVNIDGTDYTTTVTANTWSITGIDLSGLSDGGAGVAYPVTADVSDTAGNPAPTATRPITLTDTTAPTISINVIAGDDVVDDSEDNAVTVNGTTTNVEDGQTVTVNIDGTDYTTTVTGNAWSITGIDLSGLSDGGAGVGYPVTANVDDAAGNAAPTATRPITLTDTTAPTISINVIAGDDVVDDSEDNAVTVNGTTTNVEDGQTVTVNIDGTDYTTTVTANTWSITGIDLSGLSDGGAGVGYPVTADVSDTAGNPAPTATRPITLTDTTAPTITINVIAGDDVVDDSEDTSVTVNGTTTNVEDGQTVTVNIDGTDYTTTVTANTWSITGIDLSGLSDGGAGVGYPVTANVDDAAGNAAPVATRPITLTDTTAPTISINVIAGDDIVDDSEDNAVTVNGTTTNVEDGQTVTVNIDGTNYTTTVTANTWSITGIDLSGLSDGGAAGVGYPVTADVSDTAGNPAPTATRPITLTDTTAPTIAINVIAGDDVVDDSEDTSVTVNGTTTNVEDGQTVTVNIDGTDYTTTVTGNAWSITGIDLSGLSDGGAGVGYPVTADVSDTAGNPAPTATRPITLTDTTAPTITINVIAGDDVVDDSEDNSVTVTGATTNVEDGQTVTVTIDGTNYTTTVTGNTWSVTGIDLSTLPDGVSYNVTANVDDAAGNAAPVATRPITLTDTTAPTISINVIAGDDVVDDSEDNAVTVNGTTTNVEDGQTVTVNIDGTDYTTTVTGNIWSVTGIDLSTLPDGVSYNVTANVDDAAGNAAPVATRPITLTDTTAPTISINVIAGDDVVDDSEDNAVTVSGTTTGVENGQTVTVNIDGTDYTTTVTGNTWSITGIDLSTLPDGISYNVTANVNDVAGNPAAEATRPITVTDTTAPTVAINVIAGDDIVDDSEDNAVTVSGTTTGVEDGQTLTINIAGIDYNTTVTSNAWSITGIDLSTLSDGGLLGVDYDVTANVDDAAGNSATEAIRPIAMIDTTAPTVSINVIAGDDIVDDSEDNAVTVSGTTTGVEDGQTLTINIAGINYNTTVTANAWSISGIDLSTLSDGGLLGVDYDVTANVDDAAGNSATEALRPIAMIDTTAPTITINVISGDDIVDDSEDNAVTVSGTTTGVDDGQTVTVTIDGTNYTATVTGNSWSIPNIDLSTLPDGVSYNVTANVNDVAGNPAVEAIRPISVVSNPPAIDLDGDAAGTSYTTNFVEGGSAVSISDSDISITDVDSSNIQSATITLTNFETGDLLNIGGLPPGISASAYNPATGVVTLTGSASLADYQTAIQAIQFENTGSGSNTSRVIDVVVNDGSNNSNTATTTINVTTIPTVTVDDVLVQEPASGTVSLTFTVSIDEVLGSNLTFDYQTVDISALSGADYQAIAITQGTITAGSTSTTITVTVNSDANVFEGDETFSIDLSNFSNTVNFTTSAHTTVGGVQGIGTIGANNGVPDAVDDSYVTGIDTDLVIGNLLDNDTLIDGATLTNITNGANGTVTDNGDGTFTYSPTGGFSGTDTFTYTLTDADGETDTATVTVTVSSTATNPPVVTNVPDISYTENDTATNILSGINISDTDSTNLSSVVVSIAGYLPSQDVLAFLTAGTSISASTSVTGNTWELTLSGGADINEYLSVLNTLTYENSSENPSSSPRSITVEAYDDQFNNLFGTDAGSIAVTPVNDAPDVFDGSVFILGSTPDNPLNITPPTDPDTDDSLLIITVTGLPTSVGIVTLADGTPVNIGDTLTLAELTTLEFDAGSTTGQGDLTYDVFDGVLTTSATTTINVGSTEADAGTVNESALSGGTGGGTTTVTGNLFANDAASTGSTTLDDINGTTPIAGVITIVTALGTLTVYADNTTSGFSAGDYEYVLNSSDGTSADVDEVFTYNFTESATPLSDTLTITVTDDGPIANNLMETVPESEEQIFNLILTLDTSGSMGWSLDSDEQNLAPGEPSRLDVAKDALEALASEFFTQSSQVSVTLIEFESNTTVVGTYTDFGSFQTDLNALTDGGGTDYVDALTDVQTELTNDIAAQNPADNVQNISYFVSDGVSSSSPIGGGFDNFVNNNSVDSFAVGIGPGLALGSADLDFIHNVDSLAEGSGSDGAIIVANINELEAELLNTVPTAFGGNITVDGSVQNIVFGADGGFVQEITTNIAGTDYTFSFDGMNITVSPALAGVDIDGSSLTLGTPVSGFTLGTFTFDFADGSYTFSSPDGNAGNQLIFDYIVQDGDGDTASARATIDIVDNAPTANDDLDSVAPLEVAEGNVINAQGTDGGPSFGNNFTPFASQGGGVDTIVDSADVTQVSFRGESLNLDFDSGNVPAGGISGTLSWTYSTTTNNLGEEFSVVTVIDSADNAQFIFNSSGFYQFTPDTTNLIPPPISIDTTSQANINASDIDLTIRTGGTTLQYNGQGVGINGGPGALLSSDEAIVVAFDAVVLPDGVNDVVLTMDDFQFVNTDQMTVIVTHDTDGDGTLNTDTIVFTAAVGGAEILDLSQFSGVTSLDIEYTGGGWDSGLRNVTYTIPALTTPLGGAPEIINYTLTDSDGQSDSAQLNIYSVDNTIIGTVNADSITGGNLNDAITGGDGNDNLNGAAGHDTISGGLGDDTLTGGTGLDNLVGGDGADTLLGGADADYLDGGTGNDLLDGGTGDDIAKGGAGDDQIFGGAGNDQLEGAQGSDTLYGGAGDDSLLGGEGIDFLYGGQGDDTLTGGSHSDTFVWNSSDEGTTANPADDTITDFLTGVGGDVLDLSNLLQGEESGTLTDYLHFQSDGNGGTDVQIDADGGGAFETVQNIGLDGIDLTVGGTLTDQDIINSLLATGNLIVD